VLHLKKEIEKWVNKHSKHANVGAILSRWMGSQPRQKASHHAEFPAVVLVNLTARQLEADRVVVILPC
jgi:hypothetical protein